MKRRTHRDGGPRGNANRPTASPAAQAALARGREHHQAGRFAEAEAIYRQVLAADPRNAPALHLLGVLANQLGHPDASDPADRASHPDRAAGRLVPQQPRGGVPVARSHRGGSQRYAARWRCKPDHVDALNNQGVVLQELGQAEAALATFERSLKLRPNHAETLTNAAISLRILGRLDEAETRLRRALKVQPTFMEALNNLASTLPGRRAADGRGCRISPRDGASIRTSATAHSGLIFVLDLLPDGSAEAHVERQRWNARFGQRWRTEPLVHPNAPDPERRLRVGYVSADFYQHSAALAIMPILRAHDHTQVEVVCYSGVIAPDA